MIRMHVDLETLGTQPNSLVLAIGLAAVCDKRGLVDSTVIYPSRTDQKYRHINPDTVAWWMGQSQEAKDLTFVDMANQIPVPLALNRMKWFWADTECEEAWGNGPTMDIAILEDLALDFNDSVPWTFRQVRCLRTLAMLAPEVDRVKLGVAHSAQHDAIAQGLWAREMIKWLKK